MTTTTAKKNAKKTAEERQRHREELGLSQTEFGRILGVTQGTVSRWEGGGSVAHRTEALLHIVSTLTPRRRAELGPEFRADLETRGELCALWMLLDEIYAPKRPT